MKNSKSTQSVKGSRAKRFNFLQVELGNAMVVGSTSAGKTVMPSLPLGRIEPRPARGKTKGGSTC